jgi:GH43 family beta-xylosidase
MTRKYFRASLVIVLLIIASAGFSVPQEATAQSTTFTNPLNTSNGSDPFMVFYNGNYYLTATTWNDIRITRASTIAGLKTTASTRVWSDTTASRCCNMWAPEMHLLNGPSGQRWYLYYTAGTSGSNLDNQRSFVLESSGTDPMGPYSFKARLIPPGNDVWSIDGSVMQLNGSLYYLFSSWVGSNQNVFIAPMSNPWTLSGSRVQISSPTLSWERSIANVNEGPIALQRNGRTFIIYSASACWGPDYKLGMLTLTGTNPLSASSWTKRSTPVFQRNDAAGVYGPGHNGFFKSPDGTEDWIVYHANNSASGGCDGGRTTRVQKITWNADGTPNFGVPLALSTQITRPSGETGGTGIVTVNDNTLGTGNNQYQYTGTWSYGNQSNAYQSDNHWSNSVNANYQVRFNGRQIRLYGAKANNHGIAAVSIDGGTEVNVDFYAATRSDNTLLWTSPMLAVGNHTLRVRVTGTRNASSSNTFVTGDRVDITP